MLCTRPCTRIRGLEAILIKTCTKCSVEKDESEFYADRAKRSGLSTVCKVCVKVRIKKYQEENKPLVAARKAAWAFINQNTISVKRKAYRKENKEMIAENIKAWRIRNAESIKVGGKLWREENRNPLSERKKAYRRKNSQRLSFEARKRKQLLDSIDELPFRPMGSSGIGVWWSVPPSGVPSNRRYQGPRGPSQIRWKTPHFKYTTLVRQS